MIRMPRPRKPPVKQLSYRSAVTGRWVSAAYAKRYPHLTVMVRIREGCAPRGAQ